MRLRNLVLSLFLAAGAAAFTACEGERGPVGEAGPAGTAGTAGAKGETGDAGKSSEEIPSAYEFLKLWGKADGMAACSDDIFDKTKMAAFPGPAALAAKATTSTQVPHTSQISPTVDISTPTPVPADKGKCNVKVFADATPFKFTPTQVGKKMTEDPKRGKTAVLENTTLTTTETQFWGGTVTVDLLPGAVEVEEMDRLAVRCDVGERPSDSPSADITGSGAGKRISGEYRIMLTTETENILGKDDGGSTITLDDDTTSTNDNLFEVINYTTQVCIRLASAPGTVKCYVRRAVQRRGDTDDKHTAGWAAVDQMALYSDGKLTQTIPMPYPPINNLANLAGTGGNNFPFGSSAGVAPAAANLNKAGKLCNFFAEGVIPCPSGEVALPGGECR